jgi:hypothetical protein
MILLVLRQTASALPSNFNVNSANGTTILVPRSNFDPVIFVSLSNIEIVGFRTPWTVPVDSSNLGIAVIQIKTSRRSTRSVAATARVDVHGTAWGCRLLLDIFTCDFGVLVTVLVPLAPCDLLEKSPVALKKVQ